MKPTDFGRFWSKIDASNGLDGCWSWTAYTRGGYGRFNLHANNKSKGVLAHRHAYTLLRGPIPEGLVLDHLCRNRACVNPWHLEAVTLAENIRRGTGASSRNAKKTHCPAGHPYTEERTTYGTRVCRVCVRANDERRRLSPHRRGYMRAYLRSYYQANKHKWVRGGADA